MNVAESLPLPITCPNADYSGFSDAKRTKRGQPKVSKV
jgi:hypothetical protein